MSPKQTMTHTRTPWRFLLGLVCIGLVLLGGTLSVSHAHPQDMSTHSDCGLCIAAHSIAPLTATPVQIPVAQVIAAVEWAMPVPRARTLARFALFTRPPPAHAHLS